MSVRRSIILLTLTVIATPIAVFGLRVNQAQQQVDTEAAAAARLQFHTVERGNLSLSVTAIGRVEPDQEARLSFTSAGRVTELLVEQGDVVQAGAVLARLNDDLQRIALERAQLSLDMALLRREQLLTGADETQIAAAEANVGAAQGAVNAIYNAVSDDDIRAAELAYQQAQQAVTDAQQARATAPGDQPQQAYELLDARVGQASFNAEIARLQLEQLRSGSSADVGAAAARVEQAQAELDQLLAGPTEAQIAQADATVAQAQVEVDGAQDALEDMILRAPFDGVVTALSVEQDALVLPGVPALVVTDLEPLQLTVQVDEIDVREIREAMAANVRFDALPGVSLAATLEQIALLSSSQNGIVNYDVQLRLDEMDERVRAGMTAEAAVVTQARNDVLVVPNEYIRLDRTRDAAYVNLVGADGTLEEVEITLGLQGQETSEIVSGLRLGDTVAVDLSSDSISLFGG